MDEPLRSESESGAPSLADEADNDGPVGEATVVVERRPHSDNEQTVVVQRAQQATDETVVVERGRHVGDETVVVDRNSTERTVVVDRKSREANEATVVVDRKASTTDATNESTVVVAKRASSKAPPTRGPRGRQRINLPPVEPGFAEQAVIAAGAGAVENYAPRQVPAPPLHSAPSAQSSAVARPPAEAVPSVRKSSQRFGVIAVIGFGIACVVSVVGLTAIVLTLLRGV